MFFVLLVFRPRSFLTKFLSAATENGQKIRHLKLPSTQLANMIARYMSFNTFRPVYVFHKSERD